MLLISFIILIFVLAITLIISFVVSLILSTFSSFTKKNLFLRIFGGIWTVIISLCIIATVIGFVNEKMKVNKNDLYGNYLIDKKMFKGKNANWQYEHFSFTITKKDEFIFYEYFDNGNVKDINKGNVEFVNLYESPHVRIVNLRPMHQVVENEPLLVRGTWHFYYVFKSKKFGNMFFIKKKEGFLAH